MTKFTLALSTSLGRDRNVSSALLEAPEKHVFDATWDPYDLWATASGVRARAAFYKGRLLGKSAAGAIGVMDWLAPDHARALFRCTRRRYPSSVAIGILRRSSEEWAAHPKEAASAIGVLASLSSRSGDNWAWGLGFRWMSKNGLYEKDVPFVTQTPYVMEALLRLTAAQRIGVQAQNMFDGTWAFLQSLRVMYKGPDGLALSYAPVVEPRTVINANAYSAYAYALHAAHGRPEREKEALAKASALVTWVCRQQGEDGSWPYYADDLPGNFVDCFHSCFVLKNLRKISRLCPICRRRVDPVIAKGVRFLRQLMFDRKAGLCRRFHIRAIFDPFRWDLYDQAEYLGVLLDNGFREDAVELSKQVLKTFSDGQSLWCRLDVLGRRWGRNYLRWGVAPFLHQFQRLENY